MKSSVWALISIALLIVSITLLQWIGINRLQSSYSQVLVRDSRRVQALADKIFHFFGPKGARYEYDDKKNRVVTAKVDVEFLQNRVDRYQRDRGHLPAGLQDLSPDYIDQVPAWFYYDPQTGKVTDRPFSEQ
jgi:hypothetical protein